MTLPQSNRYKLYQPIVLTTEFDVTFPIFSTGDVSVFIDGVKTVLLSITATFANGRSTDAKVVLNSAVTDVDVEIYGTRSPRRENQYLGNSPKLSENLQNDADALTAVQQEQARDAAGMMRVSPNVAAISPLEVDAANRAGRALSFSNDGLGFIAGPTVADILAAEGNAADATAAAAAAAASAAAVQVTQVKSVSISRAIVVEDRKALLNCSNIPTLTLPLAATLGNGFWFDVTDSLGVTTIATTGPEQINFKSTFKTLPGQLVRVFCDGVRFTAFVLSKGSSEEINITSNTAFFALDVPISNRGFRYNFHGYKPEIDGAYLLLQVGTEGASGAFFEAVQGYFVNDFGAAPGAAAAGVNINGFSLTTSQLNSGNHEFRGSGDGLVQGLRVLNGSPTFKGHRAGVPPPGTENHSLFGAGRLTDTSILGCNAIRIKANAGNISQLHMRIDWEI
jgi:hypothetical protein